MEDKSSQGTKVADSHIRMFQRRALYHAAVGYLILAIIFALFGSAAYIFLFAQSIDKPRPAVNVLLELQAAIKEQSDIVSVTENELRGVRTEALVGSRTTLDVLTALATLSDSKRRLNILKEKLRLLSEFGYFTDIDSIGSREEFEAEKKELENFRDQLLETRKEIEQRFRVGEITQTDVSQVDRIIGQQNSKVNIAKIKAENAVPANEIKAKSANINTTELINTSLIRFGGVAITLFLVSLLVPVYRYNVRLSTFYMARADALVICRDASVKSFPELVNLLTPTHAFEKEPATPIDNLSATVKEASALLKKA